MPSSTRLGSLLASKLRALTQESRELWAKNGSKILKARDDPNAMIELTMVADDTGEPIKQSWFHKALQQDLTDNPKAVIHAQAGSGKTTQIEGRVIYELGKNPSLRVLYISAKADLAQDILGEIARQIVSNHMLRVIFPKLKPQRIKTIDRLRLIGGQWRLDKIRVEGNRGQVPSVQAAGLDGNIMGRRYDLIIIDDPHDLKTARTAHQRAKVIQTIMQVVLSRVTPHTRVWVLSNAWHKEDAAFTLAGKAEYAHKVYKSSQMLMPDIWTEEKLAAKKAEIGSLAFNRMYECEPVSSTTEVIPEKDIRACIVPGLRFQRDPWLRDQQGNLILDEHGDKVRWDWLTIGLDPATVSDTDDEAHDRYGLHVLGVHPDTGTIRTLWAESGHLNTPDLLQRLLELQRDFEPDNGHWVESNGQQQHLIDMARDPITMQARCEAMGLDPELAYDLNICSHHTDGTKTDPNIGIPGLAIDFQARRWEIPDPDLEPDAGLFVEGCLSFAFEGSHTKDELMCAWIARRAVRHAPRPQVTLI